MRKLTLLFLLFSFLSSCTNELDSTLVNVDTWQWTNTKIIYDTKLKVTEIKEISFRNNTFTNIVMSGNDTLSYSKTAIYWETQFPNIIEYTEDNEELTNQLKVLDFNMLELNIEGFTLSKNTSKFTPKR